MEVEVDGLRIRHASPARLQADIASHPCHSATPRPVRRYGFMASGRPWQLLHRPAQPGYVRTPGRAATTKSQRLSLACTSYQRVTARRRSVATLILGIDGCPQPAQFRHQQEDQQRKIGGQREQRDRRIGIGAYPDE